MIIKTILLLSLLFLSVVKGLCYPQPGSSTAYNPLNNISQNEGIEQQEYLYVLQAQAMEQQASLVASQKAVLQRIYSKDPWRVKDGITNFAYGVGWVEFQGLPQDNGPAGTIFKGKFGPPLSVFAINDQSHFTTSQNNVGGQSYYSQKHIGQASPSQQNYSQRATSFSQGITDLSTSHLSYGDDVFIVANFPFPPTQPYVEMLAYDAGYYTFTNINDQVVTIHKLDYCTPCVKLWSPEELAAIKEHAEAPKRAALEKALKSNQESADKGDPYGLLRMGERYRDGDGVERNIEQARKYLNKAADVGSLTAAEELKKLPIK